jgi:hypothetical protein
MLGKIKEKVRDSLAVPAIAYPRELLAHNKFDQLADGEYNLDHELPYHTQFASPELIEQIIYKKISALDDPRWEEFGASTPQEYLFWAWRACGVVCIKMIAEGMTETEEAPIMDYIQRGMELGGYIVNNERGEFVDLGWFYHGLLALAAEHGLEGKAIQFSNIYEIALHLADNKVVIAGMRSSAKIGGYDGVTSQGGHLVIVHGFKKENGKLTAFKIHNPSGRTAALRENAWIPADAFNAMYSKRMMGLWVSEAQK